MISIIVPVYNVECYLNKCLDSIVNQTYRDLEILIIDDGSIDGSGIICDDYKKKNSNIRVFHTKNKGLSCARNLGIKEVKGEWIGFIDSDDWIELNMFEVLLNRAVETGSDIVECGHFSEFRNTSFEHQNNSYSYSKEEALDSLINGKISTYVWNKLYRKNLFDNVSFPEGKLFEDVASMYKLIQNANVTGADDALYHYVQRKSGLSQSHDINNLIDFWLAHKHRYEDLVNIVDNNTRRELYKYCASAIARTWVWYIKCDKNQNFIFELTNFVKEKFPIFGWDDWPISLRLIIFLARFDNYMSFLIAYILNQIYRIFKPIYFS